MNVVELSIEGNDRQETREGYNKIEVNTNNYTVNGITVTNNNDGSLTLNGTNASGSDVYVRLNADSTNVSKDTYFNLIKDKKYYMYLCDTTLPGGISLIARDRATSNPYINATTNSIKTWTSDTTEQAIAFLKIEADVVLNNLTIRPILAESDIELEYEPYGAMPSPLYPSKVETVNTQANVVVSNKNILKITSDTRENTRNGVKIIIDDDGLITLNGTATTTYWPDLLWGIENNAVYHDVCKYKIQHINKATFSYKHISGTINQNNMFLTVVFNDSSDFSASLTAGSTTTSKCVEGDIKGINRAYLTINTGMVFDNYKFYLQVEEGEIETDFVVPAQQTKVVEVQKPMLEGDYFVKEADGWKEVHTWNKQVLDGTQNVTYFDAPSKEIADSLDTTYFSVYLDKSGENDKTKKDNIKSNYFKNLYSADKIWGNVTSALNDSLLESIALQESLRLRIKKERLTGYTNDLTNTEKVTLLNNYLQQQYNSGNPVYAWYKLANPTKLACTEKQSAQLDDLLNTSTYKNVTHIYSTDKVSPIIKIKYRKDIETMFNQLYKNMI